MRKLELILLACFMLALDIKGQSGLFMRTQFWGSQLEISWLYFTDKKVIRNPMHGVNPIQLEKELATNSKNIADYTLAGNKMNLKWGDGRAHTVNVEFKNGVLSAFDGGLCGKTKPFPYKYFPDLTYSGLASYGNVTRSVTMFLGKDGKFSSNIIGAVSGSGNFTGVASSTNSKSGTYSINGNTINFRYDDGSEWRPIAQPYDMGKQEMIIGDQLFKKN
jgi:hypothetical protein